MKDLWTKIVNVITEIDCLISLALVSAQSDGVMCRPEFIEYKGEYEHKTLFDLKGMRHPCVKMENGKKFVPNDTYIEPSEGETVLMVTGPNMGGKSTLLRQTCLAAILA